MVRWWTDCSYGSGMWTSTLRVLRSATSATQCCMGHPTSCRVNSAAHVASGFTPSVSIAGLTQATTRHARSVATSSERHLVHLPANSNRFFSQLTCKRTRISRKKLDRLFLGRCISCQPCYCVKYTEDNSEHWYHTGKIINWPQSFLGPSRDSLGWLSILVAVTSDLWVSGREFELRPLHCRVTTVGKLFTPMCLCHQAV